MTASLIASASFVIVAVAAGHRNPAVETPDVRSGNGGFLLVATASAPLLYDLNTADGRTELGFTDLTPDQQQLADSIHVAALRRHLGEDASCLNLYRTRLPTILGVPSDVLAEFTESRRFKFADTPSSTPWKLLEEERPSGRIPVIGDLNTLQYSLKKGIGDAIEVPDSETELEVAGMLDASVLQGVLLMSEQYFHDLFPDQEGYEYFLIEAPIADEVRVSELLETELADFGFDAEPISDVLADLLSVQNTYLSTFQTLGGLGLLVGTIGLATVMLRNVFERRSEIALLRAVGFRHGGVALLVLLETGYLLLWGVASGTISALLAMAPHLGTIGADLPWLPLITMLGAVVVIGMLSAWAAVIDAVSTPIVAGLRTD